MKILLRFITYLFFIFTFTFCEKEKPTGPPVEVLGGIDTLIVPDSGIVNQDLPIVFNTLGSHSGYSFLRIESSRVGDTLFLKAIWLLQTEGLFKDLSVRHYDTLTTRFENQGFNFVVATGRSRTIRDSVFIKP